MNDIIKACQDGNEEVFIEWLTQLPDPQQALNQQDRQGLTLLHHAIRGGNKKIILAIVQKGGDVMAEAPRERNIPLNMALLMPDKVTSKEVADVLLGKMQELEAYPTYNKEGNYPIHLASKAGDTDLVQTLRRLYPNTVYETNKKGVSSLGMAFKERHKDVIQVLIDGTMDHPTQFKDFNMLFPNYKSRFSLVPPVNVFVVGDNLSGKSTLIRSVMSDSFYDRFWGIAYNTPNVSKTTTGLIPTDYTTRKHKRMMFYDLASGSKCTHQNLIGSADDLKRSLFIIVVDSRPNKKSMRGRLEFWMTFIRTQCSQVTGAVTRASIRPRVIVVGSYRDYLKPFRLDQPQRLRLVYKSVKHSNWQLALSLNLINHYSLDCSKAESPSLTKLREELSKQWDRLSPNKVQREPLHSQCYILSNVFREMEEKRGIPAITFRELAIIIKHHASKKEISLYHLLPQDPTKLLKLCEDLEKRERVLLIRNYGNTSDEDTWIIYGKHNLVTMIDNAFKDFLSYAVPKENQHVALMRKNTLEKCLAPVMSLGMDVIDRLLEYFKFHDSSIRDLVGLPADHNDTPLYFFPTLLPKKNPSINTPWDMQKGRGFGWSFLPTTHQEVCNFLPRFLMSLLFLLFQSNHEGIVFTSRYLWTEGVYLKAEEMEVCVTTNSKAITLNMRYTNNSEILALSVRNTILQKIRAHKQDLQPQMKIEEFVIPKDGAKFPVSSPSTPKKRFHLRHIKKFIYITASNLSLSPAGVPTPVTPDSTTSETLPFFEPCISLALLDTASRQFLIEPYYSDRALTTAFLSDFERCMGSTYFRNLANHFEIPTPRHPLHRTSMSSLPTSDSGSENVSIVQSHEILSNPVFDSEVMPDQANCSTYGKLVECLDKISIFNTSKFLKEIQERTYDRESITSVPITESSGYGSMDMSSIYSHSSLLSKKNYGSFTSLPTSEYGFMSSSDSCDSQLNLRHCKSMSSLPTGGRELASANSHETLFNLQNCISMISLPTSIYTSFSSKRNEEEVKSQLTSRYHSHSKTSSVSSGIASMSSGVSNFYIATSSPGSKYLLAHTTKEISATFSQSDLSGVHFVDKSIKVFLCPSSGGKFVSESDDVTLTFPEGAVPVSSPPISIEFGVALQGPFELPGDMVPVSPFIWFCVQGGNFRFERAIEIVLPHFMNCQNEADCQSLVFLKASHRQGQKKFVFEESKDKAIFRPNSNHGILSTKHSCFICISCNVPESTVTNANYCFLKVVPRTLSDHKGQLHFCLTYFLDTCFKSVYRQFGEDYVIEKKIVQLAAPSDEAKVILQDTFKVARNDGWVVGNSGGNWEITANDVKFWNHSIDLLRVLHRERMYPPRFTIEVDGSAAREQVARIDIEFVGLDRRVQFQIPLRVPKIIRHMPAPATSSTSFDEHRISRSSSTLNPEIHILDRYIRELIKYLDIQEVRIALRQQGTLSSDELDVLVNMSSEANPRRNLMVEKLVGMLKPKGEVGLMRFKQALEETEADALGHATILETLRSDEEFRAIEDRFVVSPD